MKKEGDIKRRYQHPDAVSYTPENEGDSMLLIEPPFSFYDRHARKDTHQNTVTINCSIWKLPTYFLFISSLLSGKQFFQHTEYARFLLYWLGSRRRLYRRLSGSAPLLRHSVLVLPSLLF